MTKGLGESTTEARGQKRVQLLSMKKKGNALGLG